MRYSEFQDCISNERMYKYLNACNGNTKRAMTLYRYNLRLSQEMFTLISCFEVSLRNKIDYEMRRNFGSDWLRDFILPGGIFNSDQRVNGTRKIIKKAYDGLLRDNNYTHTKLLAVMEFGVWKFMFNNVHYRLTNRCLLRIFPNKPISTAQHQYDNTYVFGNLDTVNQIRNRIAHHEPICFGATGGIDTNRVLYCYIIIMQLFQWMGINANALLYGLDHVGSVSSKIMCV
ncbi:MAG: Abi family protein [Paludibacteraceae bacterium]|nr:Abi family protein [Paludibacteraceae bacterium]